MPQVVPRDGRHPTYDVIDIYTATYLRAGCDGAPYEALTVPENYPRAGSPWLNGVPQAMCCAPRMCHEVCGHPSVLITENGCGFDHEPATGGEVIDLNRRDYLRGHLRELHRAKLDGVPVDGYFRWSFIDNFEWADGCEQRFGIVHCDFATQVRTPKLSARYYAEVIRARRVDQASTP